MMNKCESCIFDKEGGEGCDIKRSLIAFNVRNNTNSIVTECEKFKARGGYYWADEKDIEKMMNVFKRHNSEKAKELFTEDLFDQLLAQEVRFEIKDAEFIPNNNDNTWTAYVESNNYLGAFVAKELTSKQVVGIMLELSKEIK